MFEIPLTILSLVLLAIIVFLLFKTSWMQYAFMEDFFQFFAYKPYGLKKSNKNWLKIVKRLESNEESEYKLAIIEADSMLNTVFKKAEYSGDTLEEKVKKISPVVLSNKEEIINAHKARNDIVFDPNYRLDLKEARDLLEVYRSALVELGAL